MHLTANPPPHRQCPTCKSLAIYRTRRTLLMKLFHPGSRLYFCDECGTRFLCSNDKTRVLFNGAKS